MRFMVITERTPGKLTKVSVIDTNTNKPIELEGASLPTMYVADNKDAVRLGLILLELLKQGE